MIHLPRSVLVTAMLALATTQGCALPMVAEATDPLTTNVRSHFASETEAQESFLAFVDASEDVAMLMNEAGTHLDCLRGFFCWGGNGGTEDVLEDRVCARKVKRLGKTAREAFGRGHSRWGGDVFGWVVYGDTGTRGSKSEIAVRVRRIDQFTIETLSEYWSRFRGNPIAMAVIRLYTGERRSGCCRAEQEYFRWAERMELEFEAATDRNPNWRGLTRGCNGGPSA